MRPATPRTANSATQELEAPAGKVRTELELLELKKSVLEAAWQHSHSAKRSAWPRTESRERLCS